MKRTFKMKALVMVILALMVIITCPSVYAAKFENSYSKNEADILFALTADKTNLKAGDTVNITLKVTRMPSNGFGLCGISAKFAFDTEQLEFAGPKKGLIAGSLGTQINITPAGSTVTPGEGTEKVIRIGGLVDTSVAAKDAGDIITFQFKVKEGASGPLTFYMLSTANADNGFAKTTCEIKKNEETNQDMYDEYGDPVLLQDGKLPYYFDMNVDQLKVDVPATGVHFDGIEKVVLDTEDNRVQDIHDYVVVEPTNTTDKKITYESLDTTIATVDQNGVVTAVKKGNTSIKVTVGTKTATLPVSVTTPLKSIEFNIENVELDVTTNPTANVKGNVVLKPEGAEASAYTFTSANPDVATVDNNGNITAVGKGSTTVTCKIGTCEATLPVIVGSSVASVSFNEITKLALDTEDNTTYDLNNNLKLNPEDADPISKSWKSDNESVVTVNDGVVTAVGKGTATITVTVDGKTATMPVTVTVPLKSISIDNATATIYKGEDAVVTVTAAPEGAAWTKLTATATAGADCVTIAKNDGVVTITGVKAGTATIEIVANDSTAADLKKTVNVTVKENKVASVTMTPEKTGSMYKGDKMTVTATPVGTETDHAITDDTKVTNWESTDTTVATVSNGQVTALKAGTTTIKATIAGVEGTYELTVIENPIVDITLTVDKTDDIYKGDTLNITAVPVAEHDDHAATDDTTANFVSDNTEVASVDQKGKVTALKAGTAKITVTVGSFSKDYTVEVKENKITDIEVSASKTGDLIKGCTVEAVVEIITEVEESVHPTTDDKTVTWKIDDETVASLDKETGVITGLKEGTVTVTGTVNGISKSFELNVVEIHASKIVLDEEDLKAIENAKPTEGDKFEIDFTVDPEGTTDDESQIQDLFDIDVDPKMVKVDVSYDSETGKGKITITLVKPGTAEITVDFPDGSEPEYDEEGNEIEKPALQFTMEVAEKVVEQPAEETETPDTGDMPVAMMTIVMMASVAGIAVSKKVLVK